MPFAAFAIVSSMPILFFGVWPHSKALEKELNGAADRHLLIARNLSHALERHDRDIRSFFLHVATNWRQA